MGWIFLCFQCVFHWNNKTRVGSYVLYASEIKINVMEGKICRQKSRKVRYIYLCIIIYIWRTDETLKNYFHHLRSCSLNRGYCFSVIHLQFIMCFSNYITAKSKYLGLQYFRVAVEVIVLKMIKSFIIINENFLLF